MEIGDLYSLGPDLLRWNGLASNTGETSLCPFQEIGTHGTSEILRPLIVDLFSSDNAALGMRTTISKRDWLNAMGCLTHAWLGLREHPDSPSEAALFRMQQGQEIGELARRLYPEGVFVSKDGDKTAAEVTQELVADASNQTLFEPTFRSGAFVAKADILTREDENWHLLEVKSNYSDSRKTKNLVADLAYTLMVFRRAGLSVARASLVLLSHEYRFGDEPEDLFEVIDKTADADQIALAFTKASDRYSTVLFGESTPNPTLIPSCRHCRFFADKCLGSKAGHTVLELPNLHHTKFLQLASVGIINISDVPEDFKLTERQSRVKDSSLSGTMFVGSDLRPVLDYIEWPCHYLDFETVATVLPLYENQGCHQQVLTQFSIHHRDDVESEVGHSEYLADASRESELELAKELIGALDDQGSVVVYSSFEATRIRALAKRFPDLAEPLMGILKHIVDLFPIVSKHVYHPSFRGSFSIKSVVPGLVPDLSYDGLACADGDTAIARFARMARNELSDDEIESTRKSLFEYCRMDTLAMVRLHEALIELCD